MVTVDLSDFERLGREYRQRAENLRAQPLGDQGGAISGAIRAAFLGSLMEHEGVTLTKQQEYYRKTNSGYYGSGWQGHDVAKINPQEFIDRGNGGILGSGRFYADSAVSVSPNETGAELDLYSTAMMQPYPYNPQFDPTRRGDMTQQALIYTLPAKPVAEYMRTGWVDPAYPKHHMKPRPFGKRLAIATAAMGTVSRFVGKIMLSVGFKQR